MNWSDLLFRRNYSQSRIDRLLSIQAMFSEKQTNLLDRYDNGEITAEDYVDKLNSTITSAMEQIEEEIGEEEFLDLFQGVPEEVGLIDKKTFLASENANN